MITFAGDADGGLPCMQAGVGRQVSQLQQRVDYLLHLGIVGQVPAAQCCNPEHSEAINVTA